MRNATKWDNLTQNQRKKSSTRKRPPGGPEGFIATIMNMLKNFVKTNKKKSKLKNGIFQERNGYTERNWQNRKHNI